MSYSFKFITYNLWYGKNWKQEIAFLKREKPDIFVLQEVTKNLPKFGLDNVDVFREIQEIFSNYQGRFAPICYKREKGKEIAFGNAVFSRFPILSSKAHYYLKPLDWTDDYERQSRNVLQTEIGIGDKKLHIFTTHLTYSPAFVDTPMKIEEAKKVAGIIEAKRPLIFAGDFNAHPGTRVIGIISEIVSYLDQNNRPTWTKHPFSYGAFEEKELKWKLDYIFVSKELKSKSFKSINVDFSDHLPIVVDFELTP